MTRICAFEPTKFVRMLLTANHLRCRVFLQLGATGTSWYQLTS
jgi:hypothetical protein